MWKEFIQELWFPRIFAIEWCLLAGTFIFFLFLPQRLRWLRPALSAWDSAARHRHLSLLLPVLTVLVGRAMLLPVLGIPTPSAPDEFGYLLTADTFAQGRLTNPTSPLWHSFETSIAFHVPTYQSYFPIGYPVLLSATQVLFGHPWLAVYLVTALLAGAVAWALQAWVPPRWALLGGLFVALRIGLFSYWMNSYFGGSLVALGGCLLFGAAPRVVPGLGRRNATRSDRLTLYLSLGGLGLVVLANTRPFDGAVFALPIVLWVGWWILSLDKRHVRRMILATLPAIVLFIVCEAGVGYYNYRVTGNALRMPAMVAYEQYAAAPLFLFQDPKPAPHYRHWQLYVVNVLNVAPMFQAQRFGLHNGVAAYLTILLFRSIFYGHFYIGPLMTLPLLFALPTIRSRKLCLAWIVLLFEMLITLTESFVQVHYIAPLTVVVVLLLMHGMRHMAAVRISGVPVGSRIVRALPLVCVVMIAVRLGAFDERRFHLTEDRLSLHELTWAFNYFRNYHRDELESWLKAIPGKHLVIAHAQPGTWNPDLDKVFNGSDLENAPILWARNMDTADNCRLAQHYAGRTIWMLDEQSAALLDWRDDLRPRQISVAEVCSYTWAADWNWQVEVWVPLSAVSSPSPSNPW